MVALPKDRKAIGCKWVYKIKKDVTGSVSKYKARLVAQGFNQQYGLDYDQVYAPPGRNTFRLLLSIAAKQNMIVKHYDAKAAFLNGSITEKIYMRQPQGFEDANNPQKVCKLKKSLYGLKQAARVCNQEVHRILT